VLGKKRVNSLSVPSAKELGYEDLIIESWWMLFERNLNSEYKKKLLTLFKTDIDIIRLWNN
jgi:hypothetical protein